MPPYSIGARRPRTPSAGRCGGRRDRSWTTAWSRARRAERDARRARPAARRAAVGRSQQGAVPRGDVPSARVPAHAGRRGPRSSARCCGSRRSRATPSRRRGRAARARRAVDVPGSRPPPAAQRRARARGHAGPRPRHDEPPAAAPSRWRSRRTRGSSTGSPTRGRCRAATSSCATADTAPWRARWRRAASSSWCPRPATWRRTRRASTGRASASACRGGCARRGRSGWPSAGRSRSRGCGAVRGRCPPGPRAHDAPAHAAGLVERFARG